MITTPAVEMVAILTDMIRTGGPLDGLTWRLYVNQVAVTPATQIGDLTEASFDGYAPVVGSNWGVPSTDAAGNGLVIGGNAQFRMSDTAVTQTAFGYYTTKGASAAEQLVFIEPFPAGIALGQVGNAIAVQQTYGLPGPVSANVASPLS